MHVTERKKIQACRSACNTPHNSTISSTQGQLHVFPELLYLSFPEHLLAVGASAAVVASLLSCLPQYHQVVEPIACTRTGLCKHGEYTEFYRRLRDTVKRQLSNASLIDGTRARDRSRAGPPRPPQGEGAWRRRGWRRGRGSCCWRSYGSRSLRSCHESKLMTHRIAGIGTDYSLCVARRNPTRPVTSIAYCDALCKL